LGKEIAVARASLRRYDVQAVYALVFSLASVVPMVAGVFLFFRNFDLELAAVIYRQGSKFLPFYLAVAGLAGVLSGIGFLLGWNSAGQRRNQRPTWSWAGFFVGGVVATVTVILLLALVMLRQEIPRAMAG